ncbi:hypothetical protein Cob_v001986 [Colletotrichum orbiculare MAFF 240422]|uniref:DUF7580 domain-containing protein n=1 Tax=Colletotrichum orbiculare (strain 104-T / ATCC 96160 / CBS 514.97 / LARS 414 / MAFF 240422) TaxID=1213857 RepID=N4VDF7_COLOR|nr:hypothetical protein Cob_v001986 [Colletotrichum orbiculare MAFF 240422]
MSGIEAVGLVFGLWPIVASLVKGYRATKGGEEWAVFSNDLRIQETVYRGCVRRLFQDNEEFADEGQDLDFSSWKSSARRQHLTKRIGADNFAALESVLDRIERLLKGLEKDLVKDDSPEKAPVGTHVLARLGLVKEDEAEHSVAGSTTCQDNACTLGVETDEDEPSGFELPENVRQAERGEPNAARSRIPLVRLTGNGESRKGYQRIPTSLKPEETEACWPCEGHEANFWVSVDESFQILFIIDDPERSMSDFSLQSRPTMETDISIIGAVEEAIQESPTEDSAISFGDVPVQTRPRSSTQDEVRTCWSSPRSSSLGSKNQERRAVPLLFYPTPTVPQDKSGEIDDMCHLVRDLMQGALASLSLRSSVGMLGRGNQYFTARQANGVNTTMTCPSVVRLDDKLNSTGDWMLPLQKRIDIAHKLAFAIVQFWSTAWIGKWWTWRDFSVKDDDSRDMALFATRTIFPRQILELGSPEVPSKLWEFTPGEPLLDRLGFALVELALGKRLSQLREEHGHSSEYAGHFGEDYQDLMDYGLAMKLLDQNLIQGATSLAYQNVVTACLKCQVLHENGAISLTTEAGSFRDDVERFIVEPLFEYFERDWGRPMS